MAVIPSTRCRPAARNWPQRSSARIKEGQSRALIAVCAAHPGRICPPGTALLSCHQARSR
jgi:hypothetical protein